MLLLSIWVCLFLSLSNFSFTVLFKIWSMSLNRDSSMIITQIWSFYVILHLFTLLSTALKSFSCSFFSLLPVPYV